MKIVSWKEKVLDVLFTPDILLQIPPSLPPQFRLSVEEEICSWKKLDLDFELQCIMLLSQVIKTGHTKFGMETTASFNFLRLFPSNSPLTRLAEGNTEDDCYRAACTCLSFVESYVSYVALSCTIFFNPCPLSFFLLEKADNYLLWFFSLDGCRFFPLPFFPRLFK